MCGLVGIFVIFKIPVGSIRGQNCSGYIMTNSDADEVGKCAVGCLDVWVRRYRSLECCSYGFILESRDVYGAGCCCGVWGMDGGMVAVCITSWYVACATCIAV